MATSKKKPKEFDEAVLQTLSEPITVTLRKMVAGKGSPIELPPGPGETIGGRGYSADMVRELPSFISNEWSGGGMYDCVATGSNGEQMKWEMYFHPNQVPEITPPTQINSSQAQNNHQQGPVQQHHQQSGHGGYLSQAAQSYRQTPNQYPFNGQQASGMVPQNNPFGWQNGYEGSSMRFGSSPQSSYTPPTQDSAAAKEREERLKLEAKMERQAQQSQHEKEMAAVTAEMRRLSEHVSKRPSDDESPALKAAMDKIKSMEAQNTTQVLMQQMQAMQENTNRMFERMAADNDRKIEEMRRAAESNKQDPLIPMLMQVMQQQGTAQQQSMQTFAQFMQANQTQQLEQARLAQSNQMRPQEMLDLFRAGNAGQDQLASAYGKAWELMANGVESILHAQGPGVSPVLSMIGQGVEGTLGMAQQYLEMKQTETQANAQARTIQAQVEAQTRVRTAQIQAQASAGLRASEASLDDSIEDQEDETDETDEEEIEVIEASSKEQIAAKEVQVFGAAHENVMRLRKGVASGAIDSSKMAAILLQAIDHFGQAAANGTPLPPIFALFQEERFADLIDALVPSAKVQYREEATQALYAGVENLKRQAGMASAEPQPVA